MQGQVVPALQKQALVGGGGVSTQQSFLGQLVLRAAFTETRGWEWRGEREARLGVQMKPDPNSAQMELCTIPVS